jgi:hypothetical protein
MQAEIAHQCQKNANQKWGVAIEMQHLQSKSGLQHKFNSTPGI